MKLNEETYENTCLFNCSNKRRCLRQGTVCQADVEGGGQQCTCVALTFIGYHLTGLLKVDTSDAVDQIVSDGTQLYWSHINSKFNGKAKCLFLTELPDVVTIQGNAYPVVANTGNIYTGLVGTSRSDETSLIVTLNEAFLSAFKQAPSCLISIGQNPAYTSAVCKVADNKPTFLCFDSHSRNNVGIRTVDGKAVVLEVDSIASLVTYITDLAKSLFADSTKSPFEIVPVSLRSTPSTASASCSSSTSSTTPLSGTS
jgi:hypothetical protein